MAKGDKAEKVMVTSADVGTVKADDILDPFAGTKPHPGLEHLGRAIVDANGVPSGSPANYEQLRGSGGLTKTQADKLKKAAVEQLARDFPAPK